jgi:rod shape determining protein RodA
MLSHKTIPIASFSGLFRRLNVDGPLLGGLLLISVFGLFVLYSAAGENSSLLINQAVRLGIAVIAMLIVAQLPPDFLRRWTPWGYAAGLILLILVLTKGDVGQGARRWLDVGIRFQPSEAMKLAVPMMTAWFLHDRQIPPKISHLAVIAVLIAVPTILIAKQPDLGTSLLIAASGIIVILLAGMSFKLIFGLGVMAIPGALVLWNFMQDYQKQRVLTLLNPDSDPLGAGYIGLLGVLTLLILYMFVIGRGLYIAVQAHDTYSRLLAGSISLTFLVYVFVNTAMVTGLIPVVGVPLPLVSFGGTSMVTLMAGFGILMSIHSHRKLLPH